MNSPQGNPPGWGLRRASIGHRGSPGPRTGRARRSRDGVIVRSPPHPAGEYGGAGIMPVPGVTLVLCPSLETHDGTINV